MDKSMAERVSRLLEPSGEQKERMFHAINAAYEEDCRGECKVRCRKHFRPALTAALAICLLLTVTVTAAEYMGLDIGFLEFLKPSSKEQEDYLAQGAYAVNQTVSSGGVEVTVKQVIGDSSLVYVLLEAAAPEGVVFDRARYQFGEQEFDAGQSFSNSNIRVVEEKGRKNDRINLVLAVMTKQALKGKTAHLKLKDLQAADAFPGAFESVASGEWEFTFPLDFQQYSDTKAVEIPIQMAGYPAEIKDVSVSPISVSLRIQSSFAREINETRPSLGAATAPNEYVDAYPVTVRYQDGTSETTELFDGWYQADYMENEIYIVKTFESVINEKEIASICFMDAEIARP